MTDDRAARVAQRFEKPVMLATVLVIPAIVVEASARNGDLKSAAAMLNWVIWLVFVVELAALLSLAPNRWRWLRSNPLMAVIVLVTVPFLPASLQAARVLRLARLTRLVLVLRLAQRMLSPAGIALAAATVGLAVLGGAAAFQAAERTQHPAPSVWDSIWWAVTTVTTVGYGDVYPHTTLGRIVGIVLMVLGIGFVALLTGALAQRFLRTDTQRIEEAGARIEEGEREIAEEFRDLARRLARLEERVMRQAGGAAHAPER